MIIVSYTFFCSVAILLSVEYLNVPPDCSGELSFCAADDEAARALVNRPGFPGEYFICELRLPDHRFRWKHNKLFLLLPEEYGPAFPA
ncbi:hypothetical protein CT143_26260, partial [Escherichia coli]